ncbi:MAG: hypothetical protein QXD82_01800 [Nitrososphaerales archaeon]
MREVEEGKARPLDELIEELSLEGKSLRSSLFLFLYDAYDS